MKKLSLFNCTNSQLVISTFHKSDQNPILLAAQSFCDAFHDAAPVGRRLTLRLSSPTKETPNIEKAQFLGSDLHLTSCTWLAVVRPRRRRRWERLRLHSEDNCLTKPAPWLLYRFKISKSEHRILVIPSRNLESFLGDLPDEVPLSSLLLPGTHNTLAFYGFPFAQCQFPIDTITQQLICGIRVLDIRLAVVGSVLIAYHGSMSQRSLFSDVLDAIAAYLRSPIGCSETVIMSVKQEDNGMSVPPSVFSILVHDTVELTERAAQQQGTSLWYLDNRIPTLGEVRGRIVLFSRFGEVGPVWNRGLGIHPPIWPDSANDGFEWECSGTLVRTQDWYSIPSFFSIPEKFSKATEILCCDSDRSASPGLAITYTSAASYPFALPPIIALGFGWPKWWLGIEGMNSKLGQWLLTLFSTEPGEDPDQVDPRCDVRGWIFMDYFSKPDGLVALLVECNYSLDDSLGRKGPSIVS